RQAKWLDLFEVRAARRLIAAKRRKPDVVVLERREERADLVDVAARLGALGLPQADLPLRSLQGDQIQVVALRHLVAVLERLREVVKRLEKQDRDIWSHLQQQIRQDDALGLEARGDRRLLCVLELFGDEIGGLGRQIGDAAHFRMSSRARR